MLCVRSERVAFAYKDLEPSGVCSSRSRVREHFRLSVMPEASRSRELSRVREGLFLGS